MIKFDKYSVLWNCRDAKVYSANVFLANHPVTKLVKATMQNISFIEIHEVMNEGRSKLYLPIEINE